MRNRIVQFYTESLSRQQLTITGVARAEEIKDSTLDCVASSTSKALPSLTRIA